MAELFKKKKIFKKKQKHKRVLNMHFMTLLTVISL